jgi:glycosyltransferase involved in cell wall biosynthesis
MPHYVLDARTATPHFPGIGRYVRNLARELVPLLGPAERLTVLVAPDHPVSLPETGQAETLPVAASPFSLRQQWVVPSLLRELQATLYHSAYYLMPYRTGVPSVLTVYDLIPVLFPEYSSLQARWLFRVMTSWALRVSYHSIAISHATRRDVLAHFPVSEERVSVIPLAAAPVFRPQSVPSVADLRQRYGLPDHFVLYVGSNKPHKNLVGLVEAWAEVSPEFKEFELVIAGPWLPEHPEPRLRAEALGLGPQSVRWLGRVSASDLPALYSAATLFVFPSMYEGFGLPVVEAMACGTPVACSKIPALLEMTSGSARCFDPVSSASIERAITEVLENSPLRARLRERGLQCASELSWRRTASETIVLYRGIFPQ